ncbi:MAG: aldehyde dehydrogenase family protein [Actinobacteria bacterium]|nr:aldehyde dehydrogenase family protein [Actinomycetota bacterium]
MSTTPLHSPPAPQPDQAPPPWASLAPWAAQVPESTSEEVTAAVERARDASIAWGNASFKDRARHLRHLRHALSRQAEEIVSAVVGDTGKIPAEALSGWPDQRCELIAYYERHGERALQPRKVNPGLLMAYKSAEIRYEPLGVVGVISPWNYPLVLSLGPVVTALFAGSTVVLKPSEITPHVGLEVGRIFAELGEDAGKHSGILQVVTGAGAVGEALVRSGVDKIAFTGSVRSGQAVMRAAADTLTPVLLELGGKDPMIVLSDADLERAAHGAVWGAFTNAGQTCMAVERVYVEDPAFDPFLERVLEITSRLRQGTGTGSDLGAITWKRQLEVVLRHLDDALSKGAKILTGGHRVQVGGRESIEPTVLVDVDHSMAVMREETFGPLLPIMRVHSADEALKLANDSSYGLNSSVWGKNPSSIEKIVAGLKAGSVCVNDCMISYAIPGLPFGGIGQSGLGRTHGIEGLREMSQVKSVAKDRLGLSKEPYWMPLPSWNESLARAILRLRHR